VSAATKVAEALGLGMPKWITETLLLAALPVVASVVAYEYSAGYFDYFGLPVDLIQLDTTTVLRCLVATALISGFGLYLGHSTILLQPKHPIGKAVAETFEVTVLVGILWLLAGKLLPLPVGIAIGAIANSWWPTRLLWIRDRDKTYAEKLQLAKAADFQDSIQATGKHFVFGRWHYPPSALVLLFLWLFNLAYWYGWNEASARQIFMISPSPTNVAIVRFQGGVALGVGYDDKTRVMSGGMLVVPLSEAAHTFAKVKVGRLLQSEEMSGALDPVSPIAKTADAHIAPPTDPGVSPRSDKDVFDGFPVEPDLKCFQDEASR
jgi:hypothetical protein